MFGRFSAEIEMALKLSLTIVMIVWLFQSGSVFEVEYYSKLVAMTDYAWWKWLLMGLLIAGSVWCPSLGLALLMGIFFYLSDTEVLTQWTLVSVKWLIYKMKVWSNMSLPVGVIPGLAMQAAVTPFEMMVGTINTNPIFIGLMMLSMNLGARFLSFELTKQQEKFLQHPYFRRFIIFVVFFIATRNVIVAFWLAVIVILCIGYLFNENSALCVFKGGADGSTCATEGFVGSGLTPEERNIFNMLSEKNKRTMEVVSELANNSVHTDKKEKKTTVEKYIDHMSKIKGM